MARSGIRADVVESRTLARHQFLLGPKVQKGIKLPSAGNTYFKDNSPDPICFLSVLHMVLAMLCFQGANVFTLICQKV